MECFLMCSDKTHDPISLPDQKAVIVGRSADTKIREKKLSRNQVELTADYERQSVIVKQLGINPSVVGATSLSQNETRTLGAGGKLTLLPGKYEHFIYFKKQTTSVEPNEPKDTKTETKPNQKRRCESVESNVPAVKRRKTDDHGQDVLVNNVDSDSTSAADFESLKDEFGESIVEEMKSSHYKDEERSCTGKEKKIDCKKDSVDDLKPLKSSQWEEFEAGKLLVYKTEGLLSRDKVASFDLDGTIITTKSGRVFATGIEDWKIKYSQSLQKVQSLQNDGFKLVIFTNQGPIGQGKLKKEDFQTKMEKIALKLKVPLQVFAATRQGIYRKPMKGMWQHLVEKDNSGIHVDETKSFYVGDAAGRPVNWAPKTKKDFSCSDRTFAKNVGIPFFTPEEFFLDKKPAPFDWPEFNPSNLTNGTLFTPTSSKLVSDELEVIILVGFPASGKTSFVKKHLLGHGYVHVNRDTCGTWQKCMAICKEELSREKKVVIDNTNPDKESRHRYIQQAKKANVPVRCFVFDVSYDHAKHNNRIREITSVDKNYKSVGRMVFNSYRSAYQEPSISEGFSEILKINFIPTFDTDEAKKLYMQYTE